MFRLAISTVVLGVLIHHHAPTIFVVVLAAIIVARYVYRTRRRNGRRATRAVQRADAKAVRATPSQLLELEAEPSVSEEMPRASVARTTGDHYRRAARATKDIA